MRPSLELRRPARILALAIALGSIPRGASPQTPPLHITVVDMVPPDRSEETYEDSEPSLAVKYSNPLFLVGTAFTPDPNNPENPDELAPIYYSTDGGTTWSVNSILPNQLKGNIVGTSDISVCFGGMSGNLYIAMLPAGGLGHLKLLMTPDFKAPTPPNPLPELFDLPQGDQPHVTAMTSWGGETEGQDLVFVTYKDSYALGGKTSILRHSEKTPLTSSDFFELPLEEGTNCNQDGPSVLSTPHLSGHIYAAFIRWREGCSGSSTSGSPRVSDIVVLRDDDWGVGSDAFRQLLDGGSRGKVAVEGFIDPDPDDKLAHQRVISKLAVATSPGHDDCVYLAWVDGATSADYRLHLKMSQDAGSTWGAEITPVPLATNPSLAVNTFGTVGLLYQKVVDWDPGTANSGTWETHLVTLKKNLDSRSDDVLARVPTSTGSAPGPLGDYLQLVAVGKNFYGVFSSMNYTNTESFPLGVTFQRNVDPVTKKLQDLNKTPGVEVLNSVDPFFFKAETLPEENDFYVRDWTESAGNADVGLEPSSQRNFYSTSDVWNRRSDLPGTFTDDQPENEMAGSGAGADGDNWAFARISRKAIPSPGSQTVKAHFLVSKFGTGCNFVDASSNDPDVTLPATDVPVTFAAGDLGPVITPAQPWHLNSSGPSHLCLAVEIYTDEDPYVAPSLRGNTPGWLGADQRVIFDNNRAQRNMQVMYLSMQSNTSSNSAKAAGNSSFAIVHNGATFTRDVVLRYDAPPGILGVFPSASIEIVGGKKEQLRPDKPLILRNMRPGENRWIAFNSGKLKQLPANSPTDGLISAEVPVYFYEMVGNTPTNGFGISIRMASATTLLSENFRFHKSTFARPRLRDFPPAPDIPAGIVPETRYMQFLRSFLDDWAHHEQAIVDQPIFGDPFGLRNAAKGLREAVDSENVSAAATSHSAFLNRLDSFVTMMDLSAGDRADILQNVRWQKDVFETRPLSVDVNSLFVDRNCQHSILNASKDFIDKYARGRVNESYYSQHIETVLPCLRQFAQHAKKHKAELLQACERMQQNLGDPRALQKAHRDYLLLMDRR